MTIGSFLNSVIYRLEKRESFISGRSYCPHCKHQLGWQDLIPLFNFLILRGKGRYCRQKISVQYPLVEIAAAFLFVLATFKSPNLLVGGYWSLVIGFLIIIFIYDLKHYIIPDEVIYPAIAIALIFNQFPIFKFSIFSAFGAAAFFAAIVLFSRGKWMGIGDIKLAFFMGLFLGYPNILVALFLAFFIGAIMGIGLIIFKKRRFSSQIPFGPFLAAGTLMSLFFGENLMRWYANFYI